MTRVTENLAYIRDLLAKAAVDAGRDPEAVRLLAVSKSKPASLVLELPRPGSSNLAKTRFGKGVPRLPVSPGTT